MKKKTLVFKQNKLEENVLLFVNGPYQLIVGLACIHAYFSKNTIINVIGYDMRWNKKLREIVKSLSSYLQISYSEIPFEFKKSDSNYKKTYVLRSIWNQLVIKNYVLFNPESNIFVPKLFNNPERAIVSGARDKNLYVYDDGIGFYINRIVTHQENKYIRKLDLKKRPKIINLCPSNPSLFTTTLNNSFKLNTRNYKIKVKEIIYKLSCDLNLNLSNYDFNKKIIILCPSRIAILQSHSSFVTINSVINTISAISDNILFLIKPHPRDKPREVEKYFQKLINKNNCILLDQDLWVVPVELLVQKIKSILIISGVSTIAINDDFFESSKVIISGVLGEQHDELTDETIQFLEKLGNYIGDNENTLINIIANEIR